MYIKKLAIVNFKNFKAADIELNKHINCFTGQNGAGKTNLLDAIYYLSFCKSYFNNIDTQNINDDEAFFVLQGQYIDEGKDMSLFCSFKKGDRKIFKSNDKEYSRLADHIGRVPLIIISPSDIDYINEGSDIRRKFIDSVLAQFDKIYLDNLLNYNKVLLQRNHLLKRFNELNYFDNSSLEIWDDKLTILGHKIYEKRCSFIESFVPVFNSYYQALSGGKEEVSVQYDSHLHSGTFETLLSNALSNDRKALYTTIGIHKDDLIFLKGGKPLKKFASQGQQKTFLIALKFAQFVVTKEYKQMTPLLLLDDVFDKLDNSRVEHLIRLVSQNGFNQVFITDTDLNRVRTVLAKVNLSASFFSVINNSVKLID
ncbi:MAG: DNA replication and repair protein RecF [Bacteroidales bacterium]|nr:DNA replication and repair protein RecF [Bacteroidales bacterium]